MEANKILERLGKLLKENVRAYDAVGRFGGEEFIIVLKKCSLENAIKKVDRLRQQISEMDHNGTKVTMSFGIDIYDGTKSMEEVQECADRALYQSKMDGKNRVTCYIEESRRRNA